MGFPRLSKLASDIRNALRIGRSARDRDDGAWVKSLAELASTARQKRSGPPVVQEDPSSIIPPPVQQDYRRRITDDPEVALEYEDDDPESMPELLGRGAAHDEDEWNAVRTKRRLVQSSNVYAYHFIPEQRSMGILYVTFLHWEQGMKSDERSGPGPTYAYYDFPIAKYAQFEAATRESAGKAVWDYCRIRGSQHAHQHRYTLIQVEGDYIPRKATVRGFAARTLLAIGKDRYNPEMMRRSTLEPRKFLGGGGGGNGGPNRGAPNRGTPNRGR
jgi:hypothetical protein